MNIKKSVYLSLCLLFFACTGEQQANTKVNEVQSDSSATSSSTTVVDDLQIPASVDEIKKLYTNYRKNHNYKYYYINNYFLSFI